MDKEKNNILILTLGTGQVTKKEFTFDKNRLKEMIDNQEFYYILTEYYTEDLKSKVAESEYVAEPLMNMENRDEVIIIGTVKSQWLQFFIKFFDKTLLDSKLEQIQEYAQEMYKIQEEEGYKTSIEKLKEIEKQLNEIYEFGRVGSKFIKNKNIKIVLTRYGINQQELDDNYSIITRCIRENLAKDKHNAISFDITHSFRSMPIYNLAILQYFRDVTNYDIEIKHVYYGCFEVASETEKKAPVIDLNILVKLMNLTSGINEFKNTGNCVTLLKNMDNLVSEELKNELNEFDMATQLNNYTQIIEKLKSLKDITEKIAKESDAVGDICQMLFDSLNDSFSDDNISKNKEFYMAEKQYQLSKWYYNQNRIGLSVATALECLRSYLAPLYVKMVNKEDDVEKEYIRVNAIQRLGNINIENYQGSKKKEIAEFLIDTEALRKEAVVIRNRFAHNLKNMELTQDNDGLKDKETVRKFNDYIEKLHKYINNDLDNLEEVYTYQKNNKDKNQNKHIRLIVSSKGLNEKEIYRYGSSANISYELYQLPEILRKKLENCNKKDKINLLYLVAQYIGYFFDIEKVNVILHDMHYLNKVYFSIIADKVGIKNVQEDYNTSAEYADTKQLPKFGMQVEEINDTLDSVKVDEMIQYKPEICNCKNNDKKKDIEVIQEEVEECDTLDLDELGALEESEAGDCIKLKVVEILDKAVIVCDRNEIKAEWKYKHMSDAHKKEYDNNKLLNKMVELKLTNDICARCNYRVKDMD